MSLIKRIQVSAFRGIPSQLTISFPTGKAGSLILYGGNGTGKSSLTDAWEWLTAGRIEHLAREGAEEGAYPHLDAKSGATFVEIESSKAELGTIRLTFDPKRLRGPTAKGNLAGLRKLVPHPCHIRHADLTRFVLLTKSERYDALAGLMGFVPQMEYQKTLRRVTEQIFQDLEKQRALFKATKQRFDTHFANQPGEAHAPAQLMARRCIAHGVACDGTPEALLRASQELNQQVVQDTNAKRLAALRQIRSVVFSFTPGACVTPQIQALREAISDLRAAQAVEKEKFQRIPFLQAAEKLLGAVPKSGTCPLCNKPFVGDLKSHVSAELLALQRLNTQISKVTSTKQTLASAVTNHTPDAIVQYPKDFTPPVDLKALVDSFETKVKTWRKTLQDTKDQLTFDTSALTAELVTGLAAMEPLAQTTHQQVLHAKQVLVDLLDAQALTLEKDPQRKKLVDDYSFITSGLKLQEEIETSLEKGKQIKVVHDQLVEVVNRFVAAALADVTTRFAQISDKVTAFFSILEAGTPGIGAPKLKLDTTKDRSVVLEVVFQEKPISPAYKYLSESQLNSFGLAVSLASAVHFNKDFPFLILDDVVNSCDAYKRSQLIEILEQHLGHVQVLLLTHDKLWRDLLQRRLPGWGKLDFLRYEVGVGPICAAAKNTYDLIADDIARDDATNASGRLANYMEGAAQTIGEAIEIDVKFNRRGEYTLDPLLNAIRLRLAGKLGANHPATLQIVRITQDNAYRNWSIHCKAGGTPVTCHEVQTVVKNWQAFETLMFCPNCSNSVVYKDPGFACGCGKTTLTKT